MKVSIYPVPRPWTDALLSTPDVNGYSLAVKLEKARVALARVISEAQTALAANPLAPVVAHRLARERLLGGEAHLSFTPLGHLELQVQTEDRKWGSNLLPLEELRAEARLRGLDPDAYGRSRRALQKALQEVSVEKTETPEETQPMFYKTAISVTPAEEILVEVATEGSPVQEVLVPEAPPVEPTTMELLPVAAMGVTAPPELVPAPVPVKKSRLQQLAEEAETLDLTDFLGSLS